MIRQHMALDPGLGSTKQKSEWIRVQALVEI